MKSDKEKSKREVSITDCNITMGSPDETKVAIANAVAEGMKALQSLGGDSYGIYIEDRNVNWQEESNDKP